MRVVWAMLDPKEGREAWQARGAALRGVYGTRAGNALWHHGCSVSDVIGRSDAELLSVMGLGPVGLADIRRVVGPSDKPADAE